MRIANTCHIGVPDLDRTGGQLLVVCVQASPNLYACYMGIVGGLSNTQHRLYDKQRDIKAGKVAAGGLKLTYKQAITYFPALKESQYAH